jgi:hypothetical protein
LCSHWLYSHGNAASFQGHEGLAKKVQGLFVGEKEHGHGEGHEVPHEGHHEGEGMKEKLEGKLEGLKERKHRKKEKK